jgi:hypothetical protein
MRAVLKIIVATVALAAPLYANAIPMTWTYTGVCTAGDCSDVPSISGSVSGDPASFGSANQLNDFLFIFGDITSYSFTVGGYSFSGTHGDGTYQLDASGNIVGGTMTFANVLALEFLDVGAASWHIVDTDCKLVIFCGTDTEAWGRGAYSTVTAVPEPATLSLLGLGLLGFGLARRRRV